MEFCLGIDTSNYTTSLAAVSLCGGEVLSVRRLLETPAGHVGLRQSDAHFLHTKNLPDLFDELSSRLPAGAKFVRVGVSTRPRGVEGSYMPCFLAGVASAKAAATAAGASLFETSHQEGHVAAALYGCPDFPTVSEFYSMHLSGGTMELLKVTDSERGYETKLVAATLDVTAGQLIDRVGVHMGLAFPCGKELSRLALCATKKFDRVKLSVKSDGINLSGLENRAKMLFDKGEKREDVAAFLLREIARAIVALYEFGDTSLPLLLCGGVSASAYLREKITHQNVYFTDPALCTDNAVGVALLAREKGGEK
ncbi:MAG: hypothetical protein IKT43_00300 [Clostridia bacterium]|nr:hypothetical protein [Clostridia bacterium]